MNRTILRSLWPTVLVTLLAFSGCGGPAPESDATDPLPRVFNNENVDPSTYGPGSGRGGHGGRGMGGGGAGAGMGGGMGRHAKGNRDGTGGGPRDGTGGGNMRAKQRDAEKTAGSDNAVKQPEPVPDAKKNHVPDEPNKPQPGNTEVPNEPTRKEQP